MNSSVQVATDKGKVLIVDDEPLVALYVADIVEDSGLLVIDMAGSPASALAAAAKTPPDIAIVDISLGAADGTSVAAELRSTHSTAIIFLSGHADIADDPAVRDVEPVAILTKPCPPATLEEALHTAMKHRRRAAGGGTADRGSDN